VSQGLARKQALRKLARRVGLAGIAELQLLDEALTHESYASEHSDGVTSNERLEFLGDAVLGAVVTHSLYHKYPTRREGQLSRIRASLISRDALARSARVLQLGSLIRLGRGEQETGGALRPSVLANAFEAVVGAVFELGGLAVAADFVERHHLSHASSSESTDPKTTLQELSQAKFKKAPHYAVTAQTGPPHARIFTVAVEVAGRIVGRGTGTTKKQAQSNAAREALANLP
jgi:ribonuclease III